MEGIVTAVLSLVVILAVCGGLAGCPQYSVYLAQKSGEAQLAQAEQNRRIKVLEAQAAKDSATMLAEAEVIRAQGVAKSNAIVADGLGGPTGYLRYLYIQQLGNADKNERTVVYVPTEGLLPLTEAQRLAPPK